MKITKHYILLNKSDIISVGAGVDYSVGRRKKKLDEKSKKEPVTTYPAFRRGKTPPVYHILDPKGRAHGLRILKTENEGYQDGKHQ